VVSDQGNEELEPPGGKLSKNQILFQVAPVWLQIEAENVSLQV